MSTAAKPSENVPCDRLVLYADDPLPDTHMRLANLSNFTLSRLRAETLDASIICDAASAAASASRFGSSLPPPRFAHSAICIPRPQKKGEAGHQTGTTPLLLVFGGVNPLEDLNGVVVWDQDREGCKADEGDSASRTPLYLQEVTS